jgi:hypothetical protein
MTRRILTVSLFLLCIGFVGASDVRAQWVTGSSVLAYNLNGDGIVQGYSATELDYYARLHNNAYVFGELADQYSGVVDSGSAYGYGRASVFTQTNGLPGTQYQLTSHHYIVMYFYTTVNICEDYYFFSPGPYCYYNRWFDPWGFGFQAPNYYWSWWGFFGYGPYGYWESDLRYQFSTYVSITTPGIIEPPASQNFSVDITSPRASGSLNGTSQNALAGADLTLNAVVTPGELSNGSYRWRVTGDPQVVDGSTNSRTIKLRWTRPGSYEVRLDYIRQGVGRSQSVNINVVLPTLQNFTASIPSPPDVGYRVLPSGVGLPWFMLGSIRDRVDGISFTATVRSPGYISTDGQVRYAQIINGTLTQTSVDGVCTEIKGSNGWVTDGNPYTAISYQLGGEPLLPTAPGADVTINTLDNPGHQLNRDRQTYDAQFEMYVVYFANGHEYPLGKIPWSFGGETYRDPNEPATGFRVGYRYPTDTPKFFSFTPAGAFRPHNRSVIFNELNFASCTPPPDPDPWPDPCYGNLGMYYCW